MLTSTAPSLLEREKVDDVAWLGNTYIESKPSKNQFQSHLENPIIK